MSDLFTADMPPDVRAAFQAMPAALGPCLAVLRALVLDVAARDLRIGTLSETLKWGEPAYLTARTGAGSTIRLGVPRGRPDRAAMFFICTTGLVDGFRADFPELDCVANRAILIDPDAALPGPLPLCIARALTWHLGRHVPAMAAG